MADAATGGTALDRARGALLGLAVGDALGMPTQLVTRAQVVAAYGPLVDGFHAAPPDHPVAAGMPAGSVTDDTEQAVLLARLLVVGDGEVDPVTWAAALSAWEADMVRRGSADLLGPSTRRALDAVARGVAPEEAGVHGDTNGAAMRIAPVGVATPPGADLAAAVAAVSRVTHGTDVALAGACAVAAAVSAGLDGSGVREALDAGIAATPEGAALGRPTGHPALAPLLDAAIGLGDAIGAADPAALADRVVRDIGSGLATAESVPAAFAVLAGCAGDPWTACRVAASLGGDSDTVAAMVGAITGACLGASALPFGVLAAVVAANRSVLGDVDDLAAALLALRTRR